MKQPEGLIVTDKNGRRGKIEPSQSGGGRAMVVLENGQRVFVPMEALEEQKANDSNFGHYFLPLSLTDIERESEQTGAGQRSAQSGSAVLTVPVVEETLDVQKRIVETGGVRLRKTVREHEEVIDEPLMQEEVSVERVPINRVVDGALPIRYEGDVMIVPILEEVMVVEKKLMLKEEIRISKSQGETRKPQTVTLRSEEATVERIDNAQTERSSAANASNERTRR